MGQNIKKRMIKIIFLVVICVSCLGLHTTVFAMEDPFSWENQLALGDSDLTTGDNSTETAPPLTQVDQVLNATDLCNATFDTDFTKRGNKNTAEINMEIKAINEEFLACNLKVNSGSATSTNNMECMEARYKAYKNLAIGCPNDDPDYIKKQCGKCVDYNSYTDINTGEYSVCMEQYCKDYVESLSKPGGDIEVNDYESCIEYCDTAYYAASIFDSDYEDNRTCKLSCKDEYVDSVNNGNVSDGPTVDFDPGEVTCSSLGEIIKFAADIFHLICGIMGVGAVVLGMIDYTKAVMNADQDAMKKATKHFTTRLIILVIMLLLPVLLDWILGIVMPMIDGVGNYDSCIGLF